MSDFLVQPLALRTPIIQAGGASAGLTFKDLGEGARSGNAATVATLQLASSHAGGASQDWPSGTDTMLLFAARARVHATLS